MKRRIGLFEFEDLPWFPAHLRGYITDLLRYQLTTYGIYRPAIPLLIEVINRTNCTRILDLCSGSSGPVISIAEQTALATGRTVVFTLTDKHPNTDAFRRITTEKPGIIQAIEFPVDATAVEQDSRSDDPRLKGIRTMFTSFHHFGVNSAHKILADAASAGRTIAVFEFTERTYTNILKSLLLGPLLVLINTPFIKPVTFGRLIFTYLIPIVPLTYAWDALASHVRTYSPSELRSMTERLSANYEWMIGQTQERVFGYRLTYLIGTPRAAADHPADP